MKLCPQCETGYADSHVTCPTHGVMLGEIRELRPGMLIRNTYRVVRKLGQGGMGAVYLCEHTLMDEQQALKFLSPELSRDQAFTSRFLREVRTLRQIRHKNVVDAGNLEPAEDGTLFFSMEFVDGPDLRGFLNSAPKPFDVAMVLSIARGIAEGLGAAHAQGMVHRDIKPENILMARSGESWTPKIADFGIVATKENSSLYTRTGGTMLTMAYAAPEQWSGMRAADLDGRTDLYAFGGVLFEMLAGRTVFDAESYEGWAEQHKNGAPMPPSSLRPELADWQGLDALVLRLLAKDREQRPEDVAELRRLLDGVAYLPPATRRVTQPELRRATTLEDARLRDLRAGKKLRARVPVWVWAAPVVVLLAVTFFAWRAFGPQPAKPQDASAEARPAVQPEPGKPKSETHADSQPVNPQPAGTPTPTQPKTEDARLTWTDPATGLTWAKKDNGSDVNWQQATDYCRNLRLAGHSDWHLATISQLQGVYDAGANGHAKDGLQLSAWWQWSSSPRVASEEEWFLFFGNGERGSYTPVSSNHTRALCVRPSEREVGVPDARPAAVPMQEENGTVWTDPATGLMWAKKDNGRNVSWQGATDYCGNLQLAGHANWRLATMDELQGIYDPNANVGGYHVKGNLLLSGWHWSSSPGNASGDALSFDFYGGRRLSSRLGNGLDRRALCVRPPGE